MSAEGQDAGVPRRRKRKLALFLLSVTAGGMVIVMLVVKKGQESAGGVPQFSLELKELDPGAKVASISLHVSNKGVGPLVLPRPEPGMIEQHVAVGGWSLWVRESGGVHYAGRLRAQESGGWQKVTLNPEEGFEVPIDLTLLRCVREGYPENLCEFPGRYSVKVTLEIESGAPGPYLRHLGMWHGNIESNTLEFSISSIAPQGAVNGPSVGDSGSQPKERKSD
jgi:hypothetical protein